MPIIDDRQKLEEPLEHEVDPELQEELLKHRGRWVAMTRAKLLAVGDSPAEVLAAAHEVGCESPILYFVPRDDRAVYFF